MTNKVRVCVYIDAVDNKMIQGIAKANPDWSFSGFVRQSIAVNFRPEQTQVENQ